jgi:hypothetical protein
VLSIFLGAYLGMEGKEVLQVEANIDKIVDVLV